MLCVTFAQACVKSFRWAVKEVQIRNVCTYPIGTAFTHVLGLSESLDVKTSDRWRVHILPLKMKSKDVDPVNQTPLIMTEVPGVPLDIRLTDFCYFPVGYTRASTVFWPMLCAYLLDIVLRSYKGPCVIICYFPSAPSSLWADNLVHHYRRLTVRETVVRCANSLHSRIRETPPWMPWLTSLLCTQLISISFFLVLLALWVDSSTLLLVSCFLVKAWKADIVLWRLLWRQLIGVTHLLSMSFPDV